MRFCGQLSFSFKNKLSLAFNLSLRWHSNPFVCHDTNPYTATHARSHTLFLSLSSSPGHSLHWPAPAASAGSPPQCLQGALTQRMDLTHWQRAWGTCGFPAVHSGSCWTSVGVGAAAVDWPCLSRSCSRLLCHHRCGSCLRAEPGWPAWLAASGLPWSPEASGVCCPHMGQLGKSLASWPQCLQQAPTPKGKHTHSHTNSLPCTLQKIPFKLSDLNR